MAIQKTEAFVLRTHPFRTSSLIVTTFSRSFGKVKGIAKGVRREGMPWPAAFEPFTRLEIVFYEKIRSELHLISEVSILESFEALRENLEALAAAYYLSELVDRLTESHDPHEPIFELIQFVLSGLPSVSPSLLMRFFEIRLLSEVGLLPHLEGCLGCGQKRPEKVYFSARQGAIFCPACRKRAPEAKVLRLETLEGMRSLAVPGSREAVLQVGESASIFDEMGNAVEWFLRERLGKPLSTRRFLNQVQSLKIHPGVPKRSAA